MPIERNEFDKPREYKFHRELIQDPNRLRDRIASSRDDEPTFNEERVLRENYSTSSSVAAFTLIASAANLVSKRPLGKFGLEMADKLTGMINSGRRAATKGYLSYASKSGKIMGQLEDGQAQALSRTAGDTPLLGHLQIFEDLDNAIDTLGKLNLTKDFMVGTGRDKTINPALNKYVSEMRERLKERYVGYSTSVDTVEDLTVDKVIAMSTDNQLSSKAVNLFGKDRIDDLVAAKRIGLLDGQQRIDKRIFLDKESQNVLDTRVLSGSFLGKLAENTLGQTQIPFANLGLQKIFAAPIRHLFGEGDFSGIVRDPFSQNKYTRRVVIGDNLYRVNKDSGSFDFVSEGMKVRSKDKVAEAVLARRGQLASQRIRTRQDVISDNPNSPIMQLIDAISEDIGVGRRFATQESFIKRATIDLVKRRTQGEKVLKETTLLDEVVEEISRRTGTSKTSGRKQDFLERAEERLTVKSRLDDRDLAFHEKIKRDLLAALGDETSIVYREKGTREELIKPVQGTKAADMGMRRATSAEDVRNIPGQFDHIGPDGRPSRREFLPMDSFTFESDALSRTLDVANFMTTRLNDLIGATLGIGFRPTPGMYGFAGNMAKTFGMAAGGALALEGVKYLDYLSGLPTGGYKASNLLMDIYGVAKISAQFMREFTGLSPAARYMEDLMPGSIESSASDFARTIAPIAIALKMAPTKGGVLFGAGISALIGELPFTGLSDTPKDTIDTLYGDKLVPMRSGRYWMLGKQPFEGGKIQYFAPGMFARMRSEYKYTDTLYGSQSEYFQNVSFLPTPSNLFRIPELVGNVLSPAANIPFLGSVLQHMPLIGSMFDPQGAEYLAEKHRADRPYPTAFAIEQLANRSVGDMASPGTSTPGLRAYQTPGEMIGQMGRNLYPMRSELNPAVKEGLLSKSVAQITELSGIYKFALWDMPFKSSNPTSPQLADPGFMNSFTRSFYDESVGGLMGHTELLRRFVMSDYLQAQRQATNTIPNTMPVWLPGSRSSFTGKTAMGSFPGDRNYHIDFGVGDPYSKIPHGELRLPGAARERAFRLHSGSPGVYDAVDRFMVLADVAPNSEAFKHYQVLVNSMLKSGTVDDYWSDKIAKTTEHVKQKMQRYQTVARKFDGVSPQELKLLDRAQNEKNQQGIRDYYTMPEQAVGTAWEIFAHDVVKRVGISVPVLGPMLANKLLPVRDEMEGYIKREVYDTDEYDWTKPYSTMLRPMHEQLKATDPFTASIGGFISGSLLGANPIARMVFSTAGSMYFGARSSMRALETGKLEGGYVPEYVQERRRMDEYFDNLEYIKYRRLEKEARQKGLNDMAQHFIDLKKRTVASLDYSLGAKQFVRDALIALPTREKQLFMASLNAPAEKQQQVLDYIPEYLKPVYQAAWTKQGHNAYDYSNVRKAPDSRAAEYFMDHGMPDPDWAGFHPDVPMDAVRVKTMDSVWSSVGSDLHRSGVFGNVAARLRTEFPSPDLSVFNFYRSSGYGSAAKQQLEAELMQHGITDYQIDESLGSGLEDIVNFDMTSQRGIGQFFAAATQVLRG